MSEDALKKAQMNAMATASVANAFRELMKTEAGKLTLHDPIGNVNWDMSDVLASLNILASQCKEDVENLTSNGVSQAPQNPPSIGTWVRSQRAGSDQMLNPIDDDLALTRRIVSSGAFLDGEGYEQGVLDAKAGRSIDDNPYDLHDDAEAINHLTWLDGFNEQTPDESASPSM